MMTINASSLEELRNKVLDQYMEFKQKTKGGPEFHVNIKTQYCPRRKLIKLIFMLHTKVPFALLQRLKKSHPIEYASLFLTIQNMKTSQVNHFIIQKRKITGWFGFLQKEKEEFSCDVVFI
jgi:hypothetical protein